MNDVTHHRVEREEAGLRLDRWFKRHFPGLSHNRLEKLLRTGQVRIDGRRVKAGTRLDVAETIRIPPFGETSPAQPPQVRAVEPAAAQDLRARVLYRDSDVIVLDKPAGLAVQGGSKTVLHLDAMLDALRFGRAERPRLVHRLDKDTSGTLLLARSANAAARLTAAFRKGAVQKLYWALVVGVPRPARGLIEAPLAKRSRQTGERVVVDEGGKAAATSYAVIDTAGRRIAWLALKPESGRTHQLRVHCAALGTPIFGDRKYGGPAASPKGMAPGEGLHLHARSIGFHDAGDQAIEVAAPLPPHMRTSWDFFGFDREVPSEPW